jgi:hypothetical protein
MAVTVILCHSKCVRASICHQTIGSTALWCALHAMAADRTYLYDNPPDRSLLSTPKQISENGVNIPLFDLFVIGNAMIWTFGIFLRKHVF